MLGLLVEPNGTLYRERHTHSIEMALLSFVTRNARSIFMGLHGAHANMFRLRYVSFGNYKSQPMGKYISCLFSLPNLFFFFFFVVQLLC